MIFAHKSVLPFISGIKSITVSTGFKDNLGNKGGIGITMLFGKTSFCFIAAHLAAGFTKVNRRVEEFERISKEVAESLAYSPAEEVEAIAPSGDGQKRISAVRKGERNPLERTFNYVFWFGDLNFRLHSTRLNVDKLLQSSQIANLILLDQLTHYREFHPAFLGFSEGKITFKPTYKFDVDCGKTQNLKNLAHRDHGLLFTFNISI